MRLLAAVSLTLAGVAAAVGAKPPHGSRDPTELLSGTWGMLDPRVVDAMPQPPHGEKAGRRLAVVNDPVLGGCFAGCQRTLRRKFDEAADVECRDANETVVQCQDIRIMVLGALTGNNPFALTPLVGLIKMVEHINARQEVLPGYRIIVDMLDSKMNPPQSREMYIEMSNHRETWSFLMAGDPTASDIGILEAGAKYVNIVTGYLTGDDEALNMTNYPDVIDFFAGEVGLVLPPAIAMMEFTGWRECAVISVEGDQVGKDNSPMVRALMDDAVRQGRIDSYLSTRVYWEYNLGVIRGVDMGTNGGAAQEVLDSNYKVLIFDTYYNPMAWVLCHLYKAGRSGFIIYARIQIPDYFYDMAEAAQSDYVTDNGCSALQIASMGTFFKPSYPQDWYLIGQPPPQVPLSCDSGSTAGSLFMEVMALAGELMSLESDAIGMVPWISEMLFVPYVDALCLWSLAAREQLIVGNRTADELTNPTEEVRRSILDFMRNYRLDGIQGPIYFRGGNERVQNLIMMQEGLPAALGSTRAPVGVWNAEIDRFLPMQFPPVWGFNADLTPVAGWQLTPTATFPECGDGSVMHLSGCRECGADEVYIPSSSSCVCAPGYRTARCTDPLQCRGRQHHCLPCQPGSYSDSPGQDACRSCSRGMYIGEQAQTECFRCPLSMFQNETGQAQCVDCPATFESLSLGALSVDECTCPVGKFLFRSRLEDEPHCIDCLEGLVCNGGNGAPLTAPRYSAGPMPVGAEWLGIVPSYRVKCASFYECPGNMPIGRCPENREQEERACALCQKGYIEENGVCVSCTERAFSAVPLVLSIIAAIAFVVALFFYAVRDVGVKSQTMLTITIAAGIVINTLQSLGAFREIAIDWPEPLASIMNAMKVFAFRIELINPGCVFNVNSPVTTYLGVILAFPCFIILVCIVFAAASTHCFPDRCIRRKATVSDTVNTIGLVTLALYTSLSISAFLPWQCEENPDGSLSMVSSRSMECWTEHHKPMLWMSTIALLFYVLGFFALIMYATFKYPAAISREGGIKFLRRYHFLFDRFSPKYHYFGVIYCTRNLIIAVLPVAFANEAALQLMLMSLLFASYLSLVSFWCPWRSRMPNFIDASSCICLVMILVGGTLVMENRREHAVDIVSYFFVVVIVAFTAMIVGVAVKGGIFVLFPPKIYGAFLCHHKVGAAVLARWMKMELQGLLKHGDVFLDSDNLEQLDRLFETVSFNTQNLVCIMTKQLLERIWCAGEITTATKSKVNIIRMACDDYSEPTNEFIGALAELWSEDQINEVGRLGVHIPDIQAAFTSFRDRPSYALHRAKAWAEQEQELGVVYELCRGGQLAKNFSAKVQRYIGDRAAKAHSDIPFTMLGRKLSMETGQPQVTAAQLVVIAEQGVAEHHILSLILSRRMQQELLIPCGACSADCDEAAAQAARARCILPLLTGSVLGQAHFAVAVTAGIEAHATVIPVCADNAFVFPGPSFWPKLEDGSVLSASELEGHGLTLARTSEAYHVLFKSIALFFTAHGSDRIQTTQVMEIAKRYSNSGAASHSKDASKDAGAVEGSVSLVRSMKTSSSDARAQGERAKGGSGAEPDARDETASGTVTEEDAFSV